MTFYNGYRGTVSNGPKRQGRGGNEEKSGGKGGENSTFVGILPIFSIPCRISYQKMTLLLRSICQKK